jgi:hypothetical protein
VAATSHTPSSELQGASELQKGKRDTRYSFLYIALFTGIEGRAKSLKSRVWRRG